VDAVAADLVESSAQSSVALGSPEGSSSHLGGLNSIEAKGQESQQLASELTEFPHLPESDLRRAEIAQEVLDLIPETVARQRMIMPVKLEGDVLQIAAARPSQELEAELALVSGCPVHLLVAPESDVRWAIDDHYRAIDAVDRLVEQFEASEQFRGAGQAEPQAEVIADDAPVVQVVDRILAQAIRDGASDVHIEPGKDSYRIRFRVDGALTEILRLPPSMGMGLVSRIKIMAEMNIVERRRPQDGQLTTVVDDVEIDVRVATVATIWGETCVMRILDKTRSVMLLADLGMSPRTNEEYAKVIRAPFGMVLCVGPTGSGKTTTVYASLNEIADPTRNVMTIEDPVEYVFPAINQIQTNEQAGLTFATGLKSILRQDPDVILVGEIRDVETARIAVQSALTGHLVLSCLHATDAVSSLLRFLDMGIESFLIASSVVAIVGQRLVRRICPACKSPYEPSDEEQSFYQASGGPQKEVFYKGMGCNFCRGTGCRGRIGVYELLMITPELRQLIVGWATEDELRALAKKQGMVTMREQGIELVNQDITTVSEVIRSIYSI
jgi:type IV pilus assembly protein PilB